MGNGWSNSICLRASGAWLGAPANDSSRGAAYFFPIGCSAPELQVQPTQQVLIPGGTAHFSTRSDDDGATFQWRRNGVALAEGGRFIGTTTRTLTIAGVQTDDEGNFDCVVSNECGRITTYPAQLICRPVLLSERALIDAGDAGSLGARWVHALAWDSSLGTFVSFGGRDAANVYNNDTLIWNGTAWEPAASDMLPPARTDHAMCSAPGGGLLLFGGRGSDGQLLNDTWLFQAGQWTPVLTLHAPGLRPGTFSSRNFRTVSNPAPAVYAY